MRSGILAIFLLGVLSVSKADDYPDNAIQLQGQLSLTAPADNLKLEFTTFITREEQTETVKALEDRVQDFVKAFKLPIVSADAAPVTSFVIQLLMGKSKIYHTTSPRNVLAGPAMPTGTTYSQTLTVRFLNIRSVSQTKFQISLAEILQKFHDTAELTPEPDVTIPTIIFESNQAEKLRAEAEQKVMESLKKRAQNLAKLAGRNLGKISNINNDTTMGNPGKARPRWIRDDAVIAEEIPTSQVTITVNLCVTFELID